MKKYLPGSLIALAVVGLFIVFLSFLSDIIANKDMPGYGDEPDIPGFLTDAKSRFTKEEFMLKRAEGIGLKRGISKDQPFDPKMRQKAIRDLEKQQEFVARQPETPTRNALLAAWTPIGPAPIPNGQTELVTTPVSGRTIAIAIHPSNPGIVYVGTAQGGVYRTTDGGVNWTPIFDSALSLAIGALAIAPSSPETLYVGTGEPNFSADSHFGVGLYRIENASTTATLNGPFNLNGVGTDVFSGSSISEIIVHPTDPATIFLSSTIGFGGIVPTTTSIPPLGLYRSTNATAAAPTFTKIAFPASADVRDIAIDPTDPNILIMSIVTGGGGIFRLTDALAPVPTSFTGTPVFPLPCATISDCNAEVASQRSPLAISATFYAAGVGGVARSLDGGMTWSTQIINGFCGGQCFYDIAIAVDPTDPTIVYLGGDPTIIAAKSTTSATSFTDSRSGLHVDTHAIEVSESDPTQVWLGTDGGIYKSIDGGLTWTPLNNTQFSATQFMSLALHPTDPNFTIGGTQDNGTNFYMPAGTWFRADFGDGGYAQIDQNAPDTTNVRMYHTYFNASTLQGYATVSSTASASDGLWTFRGCTMGTPANGISCDPAVNFYAPLERGPGTPNTIYYGTDRLYRSADTGVTHTIVSQGPITAGVPISSIGISPQNDLVRIVGLNNGGLFGTSAGSPVLADLDPTNAIPNVGIARTIVDPTNQTTAYVTLSTFTGPTVWKTTTLNALIEGLAPTWFPASGAGMTALPSAPVNAIVVDPLNPTIVYVGTDIGVFASIDGGASWNPFGTGLPRIAVFGIGMTNAAPRQVRIATHGRGMFQTPALLAPTAASVTVGGRVLTPEGFSIPRALVSVTNSLGETRSATANMFGFYQFAGVAAGETYTFDIRHKQYQFEPRVVSISDELRNLNFTALSGSDRK